MTSVSDTDCFDDVSANNTSKTFDSLFLPSFSKNQVASCGLLLCVRACVVMYTVDDKM